VQAKTPDQMPQNANVIAKPPLLFLGFVVTGVLLNTLIPTNLYRQTLHWPLYLGDLLLIDGLVLVWLAGWQFKRANTPLNTSASVKHIVTRGIYRYTRNPIYLGMISVYLGLALIMNNSWLMAGLAILLPIISIGVISREERYLETLFQDEYRDYRHRVRRWI